MSNFNRGEITRSIGIDMAHRVPQHGSKCKSLHGHRYTIEVTAAGELAKSGQEEGMVLDYGFLKMALEMEIDVPCDHGTCLFAEDQLASNWLGARYTTALAEVEKHGYHLTTWGYGKLYLLHCVPTAENLARHWFERLLEPVAKLSDSRARVESVKVWETPNCFAVYRPW